jgi:hypothetical protein
MPIAVTVITQYPGRRRRALILFFQRPLSPPNLIISPPPLLSDQRLKKPCPAEAGIGPARITRKIAGLRIERFFGVVRKAC